MLPSPRWRCSRPGRMAAEKGASARLGPSVRFLCDAMLGGLAKWLRAAGYDTYYAREGTDVSDGALVRRAIEEGRVLLTSDRGFLERKPVRDEEVLLLAVPHLPLEEQLRLVVGTFDLAWRTSRGMPCSGSWRRCSRKPWSSGCRRH